MSKSINLLAQRLFREWRRGHKIRLIWLPFSQGWVFDYRSIDKMIDKCKEHELDLLYKFQNELNKLNRRNVNERV